MNTLAPARRRIAACLRMAAALAFLAAITVMPLYTNGRAVPLPENAAPAAADPTTAPGRMQTASDEADAQPEFLALTGYLSRRYRIDTEATGQFVSAARGAGEQFGLDPLLILAVIAIESRFNPIAESVVGAKGLMQIVPDMHPEQPGTLRGAQAMLDPTINIQTGARILSECIDREGSLEGGLQLYNGAASDTSTRYAQKVMAEQERLRQAMRESAHERRG